MFERERVSVGVREKQSERGTRSEQLYEVLTSNYYFIPSDSAFVLLQTK